MFARSAFLVLCVLVAISTETRVPNCSKYPFDFCPMNYDPICGTNRVTYGNECMMCGDIKTSKTKIKILKQGKC